MWLLGLRSLPYVDEQTEDMQHLMHILADMNNAPRVDWKKSTCHIHFLMFR
jgi:hypothetical protein